ncbi:MAG: class I SAM-dependent methyltransferase [Pirellulaceae bacterium]|nr:class I SAM-dependent methyltransferase [Pirellulaceae bacterium]
MSAANHVLTLPASDDELRRPLEIVDGIGWLNGGIQGWRVLCLAAGGGRHGPLYAAAGAQVTVVDLSPEMLAKDREMSRRKKLDIRTIETSMDNLSALADEQFDLVIHPVSTCYLPSVDRVFAEIARVTRPDGLYISQHKQPLNLQASLETFTGRYVIQHAYYDPQAVPPAGQPSRLREPGTREFAHSWQAILGGICRSGFVIEDLIEPNHADPTALPGSFGHRCHFIAPYLRVKARRRGRATAGTIVLE